MKEAPAITPDVIRKLHVLALGGHSGDAGQWKRQDNEIVEILPDGRRRIRFPPTPSGETPAAIAWLCDAFRALSAGERIPLLPTVATFVLDFLCVHPNECPATCPRTWMAQADEGPIAPQNASR